MTRIQSWLLKRHFRHLHPATSPWLAGLADDSDHFCLISSYRFNRALADIERLHLFDVQNWVDYYSPGEHEIKPLPGYRYVAVVNLTPVADLTIVGAEISIKTMASGLSLCVGFQ